MTHQGLKIVTPPSGLAISLSDAKNYLRVSGTADDTMITGFITSATDIVERYLDRKLLTQTWQLWMDSFPGKYNFDSLHDGVQTGKLSEYLVQSGEICIPLMPLVSVTHLKTYDDDGTANTFSSSSYIVDTISEPGRLSLKNDTTWPSTYLRPVNGIEIQFVVGYGAASDIPTAISQAINELVAKFYESRGCSDSSIPKTALALLQPFRIQRVC